MNPLEAYIMGDDPALEKRLFELQAEVCKTLANPKRLEIISALKDGEKSVTDLVGILGVPKANVSQHLAVMRNSGVLVNRRDGVNIFYSLASHKVTRAGTRIHLGPKEFKLLALLMEKPARVFTRETLLDRVWGKDIYVEDRTVDVHIGRLRKAINLEGTKDLIRTVRGVGYALNE